MAEQTYEEIIEILKSLKSVKDVVISINAEYWGVEWAVTESENARWEGTISKWKTAEKKELMIKWSDRDRNESAVLENLDKDSEGISLKLRLHAYADGSPVPVKAAPASVEDEEEAEDEDEEEAEDEDKFDDTDELSINGVAWKKAEAKGIAVDARTRSRTVPSLNKGHLELKTIHALFDFLLPEEWIELIIKYTNPKLQGHDPVNKKLDKGEVLRFMGYMLSLSVHSGIAVEKMWSKTALPDSTMPAPAMGRFGISLDRFKKLRSVLSFGPADATSFEGDEWCFVRPLLDSFNKHMIAKVIPGWLLGVDESMCAWRGKIGKGDIHKIPHRSFVKRKPEPCGVEFKNIGDALSGIILNMEMIEGKADVLKWEFYAKGEAAKACTMRLAKPWFGSERVVAGDSWFASYKTAEGLAENGLFFIGDVKTATRRYPVDAITNATPDENGAWAVYTSKLELGGDRTVPIYSVSHRRGDAVHKFIATCGTTLVGTAHMAYFEDEEERYSIECADIELTRKCPRVLNDFTLAQPTIDRHNRYRQAILAMEKRLVTNHFNFRYFTTLLGILACNAFFAHRYFNSSIAEFKPEMDKLGLRLMNNHHAASPSDSASSSPSAGRASPSSIDLGACGECHEAVPLRLIPGYADAVKHLKKKGTQQRCVWCNRHTTWACKGCSKGAHCLVPICPSSSTARKGDSKGTVTHHPCLGHHSQNPTYFPKGKQARGAKRARGAGGSSPATPERDESDEDE